MKFVSGDKIFFGLALILALAGLAIFSSAALGLLAREGSSVSKDILFQTGLGFGLGIAALVAARSFPLSLIKKLSPYIFLITLVLTALVFIPGIGFRFAGATRWINIGFTTIQPAEFLKIGFVLALAWWLAPRARSISKPRTGFVPFIGFLAIPTALLLAQPNTSTTILIALTGASVYFAAGAPWRDFVILGVISILALGAIVLTRPYALARVTTFFNPSGDALGSGYQLQQSLIAVGSGGLLGRGLGQSVEKFNYLPEPDGDSVFAVFAEEAGFVGAILLLAVFVGFAARGIVIAGNSRDLFGGLISVGFSVLIILQAFMNICSMIGIIPLTGIPLPFVSHGGTALISVFIMCGLVLNVAAHRHM